MDTLHFPQSAKVLVLHPGKMGASVGQALQMNGHTVFCSTSERSSTTKERASRYGFIEIPDIREAIQHVDVIVSISMGAGVFPHAEKAIESGFAGIFIDANHIGDESQERLLGSMLKKAGIKYVEASIYGWPYPHEANPHAERTMYLSGRYASYAYRLLHGTVFNCLITETDWSAKAIKRWREEKDRKNTMPHTDHGYGVVEFHDVFSVDPNFIASWLERRRLTEPRDYSVDENGFYVNRGGYKFTEEQIKGAPERYLNLTPPGCPQDDADFSNKLEQVMFDCINAYANIYPEVKDCLWWRSDAHVAVYGVGAGMGMHHDNAIGGASANENPLFNVVSGSLILADNCSGGELGFRFINEKIKPKAGSAVFYPSSFMGSHTVSKITEGMRISYLEFFGHGSRPGQVKKL